MKEFVTLITFNGSFFVFLALVFLYIAWRAAYHCLSYLSRKIGAFFSAVTYRQVGRQAAEEENF
jgi:hypothetical protein